MRACLVLVLLAAAGALASTLGCSSSSGGGGSGAEGDASLGGSSGGSGGGSGGSGCMLVIALEEGGPPTSCLWSQESSCTSTRVPGHCPSADLFGCCVLSPMGFTQATCDYGDGGSLGDMIAMGNCEDAGNTWQTTAP